MTIAANAIDVVFVDDEDEVRRANAQTLTLADFGVVTAPSGRDALGHVDQDFPGIVVTDLRMSGMDGLELLGRVRSIDPEIPVILVTGHGDVPTAVRAMREGVFDFIEKPYPSDRLIDVVTRALERRRLVLSSRARRAELDRHRDIGSTLLGRSAAMERLRATIAKVAHINTDVLIWGETGTGKELVARALHDQGVRRSHPFVAINCGALPEAIAESELFGHESGAFTGASRRRVGRIEQSHQGTLFLDEVESMPPPIQVKLLRVLQERVVEPVGTNRLVPVDMRVVAATKVDLGELSADGGFREDLYHRLNVVVLRIPALRERREDIPLLFEHFVAAACQRFQCEAPPEPSDLHARLMRQEWPGNVRQLQHEAERFVLGLSEDLDGEATPLDAEPASSLSEQVERFERSLIESALARYKGNVSTTIQALGVPRKSFYEKLRRLDIDLARYR